MSKKIKLVALLILISAFGKAQDQKAAFKKAVDYCNCRIANTYCKQYSEMNPTSKPRKSYDEFNNNLFKCSISQSLPYDSINTFLSKNNFPNFSKMSSVVMSRILKEDIKGTDADDAVSKIISGIYDSKEFKSFLKFSQVDSLRDSLTKEISVYLTQSFGAGTKKKEINIDHKDSTENQTKVSQPDNTIDESEQSSFSINWTSIIFVIIISGLLFIILKIKMERLAKNINMKYSEVKDQIQKKLAVENRSKINSPNFSRKKIDIEKEILRLDSLIALLRSDVDSLLPKIQNQSELQQSLSNPAPHAEKQQKIEILFAPIPNKDGSFNASKVTSTEDQSSSFYKFTITDNLLQKATFEFLNVERAIKDATSSPELILNPVCKIKNALNQNAKKIKTINPGTVVKQNDKWVLSNPAEIEYE